MSQGFGICGHKNNFSTKILNGNWVEDRIGMRLAETRPEVTREGITTDTRENFIDPKYMSDRQTRDCPPINNVAIESARRGLSSDTLFGHGKSATNGGMDDTSRFCSIEQAMMGTQGSSGAVLSGDAVLPVKTSLAREKAKARARDARMALVSTARSQQLQVEGPNVVRTTSSFGSDQSFTKEFIGGEFVKRRA